MYLGFFPLPFLFFVCCYSSLDYCSDGVRIPDLIFNSNLWQRNSEHDARIHLPLVVIVLVILCMSNIQGDVRLWYGCVGGDAMGVADPGVTDCWCWGYWGHGCIVLCMCV